jgi:hypothetical protein
MEILRASDSAKRRDHFDLSKIGQVEGWMIARLTDRLDPGGTRFSIISLDDGATVEEIGRHVALHCIMR